MIFFQKNRFFLICILLYAELSFFITGCNDTYLVRSGSELKETSYVYEGSYNLVPVPVPVGGIAFPIGIDDDDTATVDHAFFIGDSEVTVGLWFTVSRWASHEKIGERYSHIFFTKHPYFPLGDMEFPMTDITYIQILIWCNAYTEWYNEQFGTNLTPVYTDGAGKPIRKAMAPINPQFDNPGPLYHIRLNEYLDANPGMKKYLENTPTSGNGFRLPTPEEWELAARWNGTGIANTVTTIINGINFSAQTVKFTKGNSASGAGDLAGNLDETGKFAVFAYNSGSALHLSKTKAPNALGLYDMSGNLQEYMYYIDYFDIPSKFDVWGSIAEKAPYPFAQTKGGFWVNTTDAFWFTAVGSSLYVDATAYNNYYGFRPVRNLD